MICALLAAALSLYVGTAFAQSTTFGLQVPAKGATTYTDANGNQFTMTIPSTIPIGTITVTPAADPPRSAVAPDGSALFAYMTEKTAITTGSLTTQDGTWTYGTNCGTISATLMLNGTATGGCGQTLLADNGGHTYAQAASASSATGTWYEWENGVWTSLNTTARP